MYFRGYMFGVKWIAGNDEPEDLNPETVKDQISVALIADLFSLPVHVVASDVIRFRLAERSVPR